VHAKPLSSLKLALASARNSLAVWPQGSFELDFFRNKIFGIETVLLNKPEAIRHVLSGNFGNYVRPSIMGRLTRPVTGNGLFLAEGGDWRVQRRKLASVFTPANIATLLPHFQSAAQDMIAELVGQPTADLSEQFQTTALDAVLRALFSLDDADERRHVGQAVRAYMAGPAQPSLFDIISTSESAFGFALGRRRAFQKRWFALLDGFVAARVTAKSDKPTHDLLDLLMHSHDPETGQPLSATAIRDQTATMIFGGYETTARLLFWATYLLALDQAEQARVSAEIADFPPDRVCALKDLENWPHLRLVLLEALRLYPPIPILIRQSVADDVILGEPVRAGAQVYIAPWVMHRHRAYWDEPTAFKPDRFAGQVSPWTSAGAYLPFGDGRRICIGASFALAEAQIVLASLLSRFRVRLDDAPSRFAGGTLDHPAKPSAPLSARTAYHLRDAQVALAANMTPSRTIFTSHSVLAIFARAADTWRRGEAARSAAYTTLNPHPAAAGRPCRD
jgi:cytochrome P450